jgi:para-nitrobenzyl esterase
MYMQAQPQLVDLDEKSLRSGVEAKLVDPFGIPVPPSKIDEFIKIYRKTRPSATPYEIVVAITSDRMRIGAIRAAERKASIKAPVYMYLFTWKSPFNPMLGSCHSLELPFVFNNVDPPIGLIGNSPQRFKVAENMSQAWIAFARNGNPTHKGIPNWPQYSLENRETMLIDVKCKVENDPRGAERKAWDNIG